MQLPYLKPESESGPDWLWHQTKEVALRNVSDIGIPEESISEMKSKDLTCSLVAAGATKPSKPSYLSRALQLL